MTFIHELARHPITEIFGLTLIHFLWQGCLVAMVGVLVVGRFTASSQRYTGYCATLFLMSVTPGITFLVLVSDADPADRFADAGSVVAESSRLPVRSESEAIERATDSQQQQNSAGNEAANTLTAGTASSAFRAPGTTPRPSNLQPEPVVFFEATNLYSSVVLVWSIGFLAVSVWHVAGWVLARRLTRLGVAPLESELASTLESLRQVIGVRNVRALTSRLVTVPLVVGWIRPVLLLPVGLATGLSCDQVRALLAHELAHVRRHDLLINLLQAVVETCLFYHPAVWWVSRRIRTEREFAADDVAAEFCDR